MILHQFSIYEDDYKNKIKILDITNDTVTYSINGKGYHTVSRHTFESAILGDDQRVNYRLRYAPEV